MTGADLLLTLIILWWAAGGGLERLVRAWRGQPPPEWEVQARAAAARAGRRYGVRDYLADLYTDAWRTARARREARLQARLRAIAEDGPGPSLVERLRSRWAAAWDAAWERRERRMAEREARLAAGYAPRPGWRERLAGWCARLWETQPGTLPDPPAADPPEGSVPPPRPPDEGCPSGAGGGHVQDVPLGPAQRADRSGQTGPELEAHRTPDGRWVVDPDPSRGPGGHDERRGGPDMAEVTGWASALRYAQEMTEAHRSAVVAPEQFAAQLQQGGVSGEALAAMGQAMEATRAAEQAWAAATAALERHGAVTEAYAANPDAGSREWHTNE